MKTSYPLRLEDELYLKLKYISDNNSRSINKEMEFIIKTHINKFEKENGNISINTDNLYK